MTDKKLSRAQRRALARAAKRQAKKQRRAAWRSISEGHERSGPGSDTR